ncbi:MAG: heavy-metal-associated domain-containing protein [Flavobacteriales bacterium]|nr:heavy-metal-associated domain-containing protein [Flavobacteriales bacterium]MCX7767709.1 heavy-metal-associated domain-containing protein [Flavobacteriales bacterium]MDW8409396.1 heavy metal-associated domain-containing protein [Flavobacteriales bacterium]
MVLTLHVENLKCRGCAASIQKALSALPGVDSVEVVLEDDTVKVWGSADENLIKEKLTKLGYPPAGENSLGRKALSFVSCLLGRWEAKKDSR